MKQRFIRKSQSNKYIRPMFHRSAKVTDAQAEPVVENKNEIKKETDMTKAEEVAAMVTGTETAKKSTKRNTVKKADGLMERIDVTYQTEDNKTLLND